MPSWLSAELVWFVLGIVLLALEFIMPGLVIAFFGVGALITALIVKLGLVQNTGLQILTCAAISLVLLFSLRRYAAKWFVGFSGDDRDLGKPPDDLVGRRVEVVEKIVPNSREGRVRLDGTPWRADADEEIEPGAMVEIVERNGLDLKVRKA